MPKIIPKIVAQHAEDAAFLWILRDDAVRQPHYNLKDLIQLEARIEAHLDGLRVNGDPGWDFVQKQLEKRGRVGEVFAAGVLALESGKPDRLQPVLAIGTAELEVARGLISAFGWLPLEQVKKQIPPLFEAELPLARRVGMAAAAVQRWDPGQPLRKLLRDKDPLVKARALRAVGELGLVDELAVVRKNFEAEDEACRFWSAWSAALLSRDDKGLQLLRTLALTPGLFQEKAVKLVMRADELPLARKLLARLQEKPELQRVACIAAGALGDPVAVPWLLEQMVLPPIARVAGEAFCLISGADLVYQDLEGDQPEGFESGPTEDAEDDKVAMDADENLPWPALERVRQWWDGSRANFSAGKRYLVGQAITLESLPEVLRTGWQRQRAAAAIELALRQPRKGLFEVRAPGKRQQQSLGA
jgi:uncharacterized protein (TIGR02270 family)